MRSQYYYFDLPNIWVSQASTAKKLCCLHLSFSLMSFYV